VNGVARERSREQRKQGGTGRISLYPILVRLADRGLLEASWETDVPAGRPPRHLYRLTGSGRALAIELAATAGTRRSDLRERWQGA
jgi:PadR family transcriptional regulator PadR